MYHFWSKIIEPIIKSIDANYIVEVGSDTGINTKNILNYCMENDAHMAAIDPFPKFDVEKFKADYGNKFKMYPELSLKRLALLNDYDVILIDGDHNWYTVYNELKLIEKNFENKKFPVIFLHEVGWPYGRRDLYYDPENIPEIYRQPYKKQGMYPGQTNLKEQGVLNSNLCNSIYENNPRNGVLTAIEDFIEESEINFSFEQIEAFNGLGILFQYDENLKIRIMDILKEANLLKHLEEDRVKENIARNELRIACDRAMKLYDEQKNKLVQAEDRVDIIENQLDAKMELLQINEFHINSLERQLNKLEIQLTEVSNQANKLTREREIYIKTIERQKNQLKDLNLYMNYYYGFLEMQYLNGDGRSLTQRLISKFPSLFILANMKKTGFKNALKIIKGYKAIKQQQLFNTGYYLKKYDDVKQSGTDPLLHYIYKGYKENRNPSPTFNTSYYLKTYPDVGTSKLNPLIHYSLYGVKERRKTNK